MIILIPLGGTGERFKQLHYNRPKALVNALGKPILYYLLDSMKYKKDDIVYIPYNKEYINYHLESVLRKDYPEINFKFLCLNENTRGAAETINIALKCLDITDRPIISLDGDNFYNIDILSKWNRKNEVITIQDNTNGIPIYSYVEIDKDNNITNIIEKEKVSNYACTGAYGFESYKELLKYTQRIIDKNKRDKDEFYISTTIREMVNNDNNFKNIVIDKNQWICLGTPILLRQFCNNYPKVSCISNNSKIKQMRICFDLDNTLVSFPKIANDYTTVEPIQKNIDFLKYLKSFGHIIIIYTARRMKTHKGCVGKILSDIGSITFDTLVRLDIPYDEIYFGKPHANVYIDDLGLNAYESLEKALGFYNDTINPRSFNAITEGTIDTITKRSNDLSGEIYYYNNIPHMVKDMFPIFMDYDNDKQQWYTMEKITGISVSTLYTSQLLTTTILKNVMNSINRLHNVPIFNKSNIDIYANYSKKLEMRYNAYDYSRFENSEKIYHSIKDELVKYETEKKGKLVMIHGDTVMTNIMINNHDKIKFFDMRGKIGDIQTIYGDYLYDWAKLYQSLLGYDLILQDKEVSVKYKNDLILYFENYFIELFSRDTLNDLKNITNSLFFTLIPLHDNEKCEKYYGLSMK